jgi:hypothetical protein
MTKSTTHRSALDRQRALARAWRPGVVPLRQMILAGNLPEPVKRAFRELNLNQNNETDWRVLAALLAIHLFDEGKKPGKKKIPWTTVQQIELLYEVDKRRQRNPRLSKSDERTCELIAQDKNSPAHFRTGKTGSALVKHLRAAKKKFQTLRAAFPRAFGRI